MNSQAPRGFQKECLSLQMHQRSAAGEPVSKAWAPNAGERDEGKGGFPSYPLSLSPKYGPGFWTFCRLCSPHGLEWGKRDYIQRPGLAGASTAHSSGGLCMAHGLCKMAVFGETCFALLDRTQEERGLGLASKCKGMQVGGLRLPSHMTICVYIQLHLKSISYYSNCQKPL